MSNNISFIGRLGRDSEIKEVGGTQLLEFNAANTVGFGDKQSTNWFRCALWGKRGAAIQQYLTKGTQVFVTGALTLRKYEKDGIEKLSPEVRVSEVNFFGGGESKKDEDPTYEMPKKQEVVEETPF